MPNESRGWFGWLLDKIRYCGNDRFVGTIMVAGGKDISLSIYVIYLKTTQNLPR